MAYGKKTIGTMAYMGGVPCNLEKFTWAWGQMIQYNSEYLCNPGEIIHLDKATVSYHSFARNTLAQRMRGEWLLMLDMDHEPEPDMCARLERKMIVHDVDVITGIYYYKQPPHNPVLFNRDKNDKLNYLGDWDRNCELFEVGAAGAGCLMIRRKVFDRIRDELHESPFSERKGLSEDNSFFDRCWELGIKVYCCPLIENPHLQVTQVRSSDYKLHEMSLTERYEVEGRGVIR